MDFSVACRVSVYDNALGGSLLKEREMTLGIRKVNSLK